LSTKNKNTFYVSALSGPRISQIDVITFLFFPHAWLITEFVTKAYIENTLITLHSRMFQNMACDVY